MSMPQSHDRQPVGADPPYDAVLGAIRHGAPLSDTLAAQAREARFDRRRRIQEGGAPTIGGRVGTLRSAGGAFSHSRENGLGPAGARAARRVVRAVSAFRTV